MNYIFKTLSISFFTLTIANAFGSDFQTSQFNMMANRTNATQSSINPNIISGNCEFEIGSCNGAEINIFEDTKQIFSSTLTSNGYFQTPHLPKNKNYKLVLTWSKYGFNEIRNVKTGENIVIKLAKP